MMARTAATADLYDLLAERMSPQVTLTVSQWADAHRVLSAKSSSEPMQWRTSRTPYLREIMDCLTELSPVATVDVMKAAQMGCSEVIINWIGYVMDHVRSAKPMGIVLPTDKEIPKWNTQRFIPLVRETEPLRVLFNVDRSRDESNRREIKDYPGGILMIEGANTPIKSWSWRYAACDEFDEFGWDVDDQGDPLGMIESRQATFPRRKLLCVSTPTVKGASRIEERFLAGDQRYYKVPCPHCGHLQRLIMPNLRWTPDFSRAWYVCGDTEGGCGAEIDEHHKTAMLQERGHGGQARWVATQKSSDPKRRSYHISALYSPIGLGYSWAELARQWVEAQDDIDKLKSFLNNRLGELWVDKRTSIEERDLADRAESVPSRTVPRGCLVITAGVDTQPDRLEVQLLGHGRNNTTWVLDYVVLPGDPTDDTVWAMLTDYINRPIVNAFGKHMQVQATAIDSGGHNTHDVYHYVHLGRIRRAMAIKGANNNTPGHVLNGTPTFQVITRRGKQIREKVALWTVRTERAKDSLFNRLVLDAKLGPDAPLADRKIHFNADLDQSYYQGLLSEVWDPRSNRYKKKRGRRNEPLDTFGYALAASQHPDVRIHTMRESDWDTLAALLEPEHNHGAPAPATPPPAAPGARNAQGRRVRGRAA